MRTNVTLLSLVLLMLLAGGTCYALEETQPEAVSEKMAFKLVRGVANVTTSVVEIPKQSYLMVRDRGKVGYLVGPLKGMGMAFYRIVAGIAETVFFAVPQPGYYDPMVYPEYVWQGWEAKRVEPRKVDLAETAEKKGE